MKKRYLCLAVVGMSMYLLVGCALTDRFLEMKQSSESEAQDDMDDLREEIPEEELTAESEEKRPSEFLENLYSQLENSRQESVEDTETFDEYEEEKTEESTEKDDFSDIDLNAYVYSSNREDFPNDVAFANFRSLSGGAINGEMFYRSASPVCNEYNRAPYSDAFAEAVGIRCVLNLSDSDAEVRQYMEESGYISPYYKSLYESGKVLALNMDSKFHSNKYAFALVDGLRKMLSMEGPVLIHCIEGKDRTGFVCMLLEGLAGATYQEIVDDYMLTYYNYYPGVLETDTRLYECIKYTYIDDMVRYISGCDEDEDLTQLDMHQWCRQYLYNAGLTDEELDKLEERLKIS